MQLSIGQIVASRAGRDVARWYVVVGLEGDRVLLCNGKKRTLALPKVKNLRHVAPTKTILPAVQYSTDYEVMKALAAYAANGPQTQGG